MDDAHGDDARRADARRRLPRSRGSQDDRGRVAALGIDLASLRPHADLAPVVEHLTGIQELRGETSSLLFVRGADLDALAERDGRPVPEFLDRLEQLGVMVCAN